MKLLLQFILIFSVCLASYGQKPGWAPTPPMGWNSWNRFGQSIHEKLIMDIADAMVSSGMKECGYEYVVLDDGWELGGAKSVVSDRLAPGRDTDGTILADTVKFPHGIKYLADYIHSKGLKFGIYTAPGLSTCGGHTGSEGYEVKDVNTFAGWGVDFIKLDWCGCAKDDKEVLSKWRSALNKASRPIVLSVNPNQLFSWLPEYADMWRTTSDVMPLWVNDPSKFKIFPAISDIIQLNAVSPIKQFPSAWNDPDMLQVCNNGLSLEESKSHFSLWAIFGAPLICGNDLRNMSPEAIGIFTNQEVIHVDQDPLGCQGVMIKGSKYGTQIWAKKLSKYSDYAVLLLNNGQDSTDIIFNPAELGLKEPVFLRDLWKHQDLGLFKSPYRVRVPAHGVVMLKVISNEPPVELQGVKLPVLPVGTTVEAEDALTYMTGYVANAIKGYTGEGYIMGQDHDWAPFAVMWRYRVPVMGNYKVTFRYYYPGKENLLVVCNSLNIVFRPCKKGEWTKTSVTINLEEGVRDITLSSSSCKKNTFALDNVVFERATESN